MTEQRVDGLIVSPAPADRPTHLNQTAAKGIPIVLLDRLVDGVQLDSVLVDNQAAATAAVQYLLDLGHERIGIAAIGYSVAAPSKQAQPEIVYSLQARVEGYRKALRSAGIDPSEELFGICEYGSDDAARVYSQQLALPNRPTALLATDDITTMGAIKAAQQHDLAIPDDVSIFGFDDAEWMTVVRPPITVVAQPTRDLGMLSAERLLARIAHESPDRAAALTTLQATLIPRESTGQAPPEA